MEVGTSDSCKMIVTVIEMDFVNLELKKINYREYNNFSKT